MKTSLRTKKSALILENADAHSKPNITLDRRKAKNVYSFASCISESSPSPKAEKGIDLTPE